MKIAVVAPSLRTLGGQAVQADELIRALARAGHQAFLIPSNANLPWPLRVKYLRTVVNEIAYGFSLLRGIPKAEVVHIFSASYFSFLLAPVPALMAAKLFRKRAILNYHSGEAEDHLRRWPRTIRRALGMADALVVPSDYLAQVFGDFGYQAQVVHNIVNLDDYTFRIRRALQPRFLSTRNLEPLYDVANTLYAFMQVQARFPDATLDLVGSGSQLDALRTLASKLQLTGVRFSGRVGRDEMPAHYDEADLFLNSSKVDNQPVSILEAFAAGLPVVSTNAGGIPYLVEDGKTGLLVEPGKPHRMADKIIGLLENPSLGVELARAAHEKCREFHWKSVIESVERIYRGDEHGQGGRAPVWERRAE